MVFCFSNDEAPSSDSKSLGTAKKVVDVVTDKNTPEVKKVEMAKDLNPYVRKTAHYAIYMLGGFLIMNLICTFNIKDRMKIFYSIYIGAIYACTDEFHQIFTVGRLCQIKDMFIDTIGVATGVCIFLCVKKIIENKWGKAYEHKGFRS